MEKWRNKHVQKLQRASQRCRKHPRSTLSEIKEMNKSNSYMASFLEDLLKKQKWSNIKYERKFNYLSTTNKSSDFSTKRGRNHSSQCHYRCEKRILAKVEIIDHSNRGCWSSLLDRVWDSLNFTHYSKIILIDMHTTYCSYICNGESQFFHDFGLSRRRIWHLPITICCQINAQS